MVEGGSALAGVEDTTSVQLEDHLVSFNGNRDWLLGESLLQGIRVTLFNIASSSVWLVGGLGIITGSSLSSVWIVSFRRYSLVSSVGVSLVHVSSTASQFTSIVVGNEIAVNNVLLGERGQFISRKVVESLQ